MHYGNGRIISHFFVMLFLIGSKSVFNIVNAVFFVLFVISIYKVTSRNKKFSLLLFFAIPTLLWLYMPAYGQIFLWLDGSINYMWSYLFALTYLFVYIGLIRNRILLDKKWKMILFCIFTFLFGNYSENVSFSVIFIGFILLCIVMYQRKNGNPILSMFFLSYAEPLGISYYYLVHPEVPNSPRICRFL